MRFEHSSAQDYKSLYYAGNRIDGPDANYIVKTIKKEDGNGRSIFKNILSAYNKDGSFNLDTFVNDKTIFGIDYTTSKRLQIVRIGECYEHTPVNQNNLKQYTTSNAYVKITA